MSTGGRAAGLITFAGYGPVAVAVTARALLLLGPAVPLFPASRILRFPHRGPQRREKGSPAGASGCRPHG
ncbi:hypothetical protein [Streptomyces sp. NPDC014623]|uniref:hypothetical protein n=1 Tax=Streptomyces sp. NPDC014623 TaxID=3364875 RepID=UPI0036FAEB23